MPEETERENSVGAAEPGPSDRRKRPWVDNPKLKFLGWVVGLLATVMGIVLGVRTLMTPANPAAAGSNPSAATSIDTLSPAGSTGGPTSAGASSTASTVAASSVVVGDCLDETGQPIPCNAVHAFEVIAVAGKPCDPPAVIRYLGGDPNLDVPRAKVESAFDACVVSSADGAQWNGSVKGAFSAGNEPARSDELRRCRDDRVGAVDVSCSVAHTGEYVGAPPGDVPDQSECLKAAEAYAGVNFERGDKPELSVVTLQVTNPLDGQPHCVVVVRGNNVLTGSIRNIRTTSLPLAPG